MIENKHISEITTKDLHELIGQKETQRIEFKETIEFSDQKKFELLRDVTSIANADGGYIIIGVKTENEICKAFINIDNYENVIQQIINIILDGIDERINGLKVESFKINSEINIIIIYIPSSYQKPHMIKKENKTEFWMRYGTTKRTMTLKEIKKLFLENDDLLLLNKIYDEISWLKSNTEKSIFNNLKSQKPPELTEIYKIQNINDLLLNLDNNFKNLLSNKPALRLTITPISLTENLINISDKEIKKMLSNPPNQRRAGWNMHNHGEFKIDSNGIFSKYFIDKEILLYRNGHFEFRTEINDSFSWKQDEREHKVNPLLFPLPVTEYPVSFLKLAQEIYNYAKYKGEFLCRMIYYNVKNCILKPYHPRAIGFITNAGNKQSLNDLSYELKLNNDYLPEKAAYNLIKNLYYSFNFTEDKIPFFNSNLEYVIPDN